MVMPPCSICEGSIGGIVDEALPCGMFIGIAPDCARDWFMGMGMFIGIEEDGTCVSPCPNGMVMPCIAGSGGAACAGRGVSLCRGATFFAAGFLAAAFLVAGCAAIG